MQWAFRECLDHYAFQLKHGQTTCMDCGHTWTTDEDADKCVCPKCKAKLEVQRTKRQKAMSSTYFSVLTERKGLQLMRAFQMKAYYRKGQKADIYCWEVARYWMNEKGKVEVMARKRTMGIYMDTFCYDSDIELRKDNTTYQHIASFPVCPDMKVIPQIWRNGFDGAFHGIEPLTLFKAMLTDHRIETMMKQCRYGHVRHFIDHPRHLETCWNAYKIANRNHYLITDIGKWADYIYMLVEMGKDIRSPHYSCPDNLEAEHDRISEKIRAKKEKERTEEEIRKALKNKEYDAVREDIRAVKQAVGDKVLKVIIETCLLTDEEKEKMCDIVCEAGADYIKTSTGFSTAGANFHDVELMVKGVHGRCKVKAAGGISTVEDMEKFLALGADRLGTSRAVKILNGEQAKGY